MSSDLPSGDCLPDLFKGMVFVFDKSVSEEDRAKWTRYIVAYDGDVVVEESEQVTHLVTIEQVSC